jgi:GT2 family glycosyltransferase
MSSCFLGENYDALNFLNKSECKIIESGINRPTIRVAIPAVDSFDLTSTCLEALSKTSWPLIIDYVDNGSKLGTLEKVKEFGESLGLKMNCTRFDTNKGFTEAVNVSLQLAINNNQHCLILNNDCIVAHDTIRKLHTAMLADNATAAVGPVSMDKGAQSLRRKEVRKESGIVKIPPDPTATEKISKSLKRFRTRRVKTLAFFCTLIRSEALKQVGLLPQSFKDGLGADDLWCHSAIKKGFTVNVAHNAYAHHMHSETFRRLGINRRKASVKASRKLRQAKKRGQGNP